MDPKFPRGQEPADARWGQRSNFERRVQDREANPHGLLWYGVCVMEATPHTFTRGRAVIERSPHAISYGRATIEQRPHTFTQGIDTIEQSLEED